MSKIKSTVFFPSSSEYLLCAKDFPQGNGTKSRDTIWNATWGNAKKNAQNAQRRAQKNYIQICMYLEYMPDYIHMYICRGKTGLELSGVFNCLGLQFLCVLFGLHFGLLCTSGEIHSWDTRDKNAHASGHLWRCPCQCRLLSIVVVWPPLLQLVGTRWTESLQELCNNIAT